MATQRIWLPPGAVPARTLTASAARLGDRESEYAKRQAMSWQRRALAHVDLVPELNYASRIHANRLKRLIVYPALRDENGQLTRIEEGTPVEVLDRIQDPGGGRAQILSSHARLMFITGEGSLFGRELEREKERWSFVWNDELKVEYDGQERIRKITHEPEGPQGKKKEYKPEQAVIYRMWTPHPRRSGEADSPMRAAAEVAEELIALTKTVRATAVSRIPNGVLKVPSEISPSAQEPVGDEDPLSNPFIADLAEHLEAQVEHAGEAAAAAPYLIEAAYDYLDRLEWMPLHDPQTDYLERDLRKEAIERLARGLDFPPEVLLGIGSTNHWAAKQVLDDLWASHGAPMAQQFCSDLAEVYLRPALREAGYPDWRRAVVAYDDSEIVAKPDRADDTLRAYREGLVGDSGARRLLNIPEEYAPTEEEGRRFVAIKMRDATLLSGNGGGAAADEPPPPPGPEGDSGRRTRVVASAEREMGAVEMALLNCRRMAGLRIRNKSYWTALQRNCSDCTERANGKSNEMVASAIGADVVLSLGADPLALVKDGTEQLRPLLLSWGHSEAQASALCEMVEVYAARTLFEEQVPQIPSGLAAHIEQMREASEHALVR